VKNESDESGNDDVAAVTYQQLFEYLGKRLAAGEPCDNTLRLTQEFAIRHGLSFGELSQTLEGLGGYCDCEVLLNAQDRIPDRDRIGQESFKTYPQIAVEQGFFCHSRVDGKPVPWQEAVAAEKAGLFVEWFVPCTKDDEFAFLDLNRAARHLFELRKGGHNPGA
jgi:hypothetical protein